MPEKIKSRKIKKLKQLICHLGLDLVSNNYCVLPEKKQHPWGAEKICLRDKFDQKVRVVSSWEL